MDHSKKEKHLRISVMDYGKGIPKDDQHSIGRLGFMSHPLDTIEYQINGENGSASRSGTGLAVEGNRVKEMGGAWGFESKESEGSTFWVDVPIVSEKKGLDLGKVGARLADELSMESQKTVLFKPSVVQVAKEIMSGSIQPIGTGIDYFVYQSPHIPGYVLKVPNRANRELQMSISSFKVSQEDQESLYQELVSQRLTVETIPVSIVITGADGARRTETVYLQKKVRMLQSILLSASGEDRMKKLDSILRALAAFEKRLWKKGFFDSDLRSLDGIGAEKDDTLKIIDYGFVSFMPRDLSQARRYLLHALKADEMSPGEFFLFNVLTRLKKSLEDDLIVAYSRESFPGTNPNNLGDAAKESFRQEFRRNGFEKSWNDFVQRLFPGVTEEEVNHAISAYINAFAETHAAQDAFRDRRKGASENLERLRREIHAARKDIQAYEIQFGEEAVEQLGRDYAQAKSKKNALEKEASSYSRAVFCEALRQPPAARALTQVLSKLDLPVSGARLAGKAEKLVDIQLGLGIFAGEAESLLNDKISKGGEAKKFEPQIQSFIKNLRAAAKAIENKKESEAAELMGKAMDALYYMENWLGEAVPTLRLTNLEQLLASWANTADPKLATRVYYRLAFNRIQMANHVVYRSQDLLKKTPFSFKSLQDSISFLMQDMEYNEDQPFERLLSGLDKWSEHSRTLLTYSKNRKDIPAKDYSVLFNDDGHLTTAHEFLVKARVSAERGAGATQGARLADQKRKPHPDLIHHDKKVEELIDHIIRERNRTVFIHRFWPAAVVVFCSARIPVGHPQRILGSMLGKRMWERRFIPRTGGGPGNMEEVPYRFILARMLEIRKEKVLDTMRTQVIRISLNAKEPHHPYGELFADYDHFVNRVHALYSNALGLLAMHGGFGTVAEVFKAWRLELPLALMGWEFWGPIDQAFRESWRESGLLEDIDRIRITPFITDDIDDGLDRMLDPQFQFNYVSKVNGDLLEESNLELETELPKLSALPPAVAFVGRPLYDSEEYEIAKSLMTQLLRAGIPVKPSTRGPVFNAAIEAADEAGSASKKSHSRMMQLLQPTLYHPHHESMKEKTKLGEKYEDWTKSERSIRNLIPNSTILAENDGNHQIFYTYNTAAFVFLPGGVGTMDNVFDLIVAMQTKKIQRRPIILVGHDFWTRIFKVLEEKLANYDPPLINPRSEKGLGDLGLIQIVGSVKEAKAIIDALPKNGASRGSRLANVSDGEDSSRQIAAMQHMMRLGVRWDRPEPKDFIHIGSYPGKPYENSDPDFRERVIPKVQELAKSLYKPVGIHVMPSADLPGILENTFDGNSYVVSGQVLRAKGIPFDQNAAEQFLHEMMETFGGTIGFGTRTRGSRPRPSTPTTLFITQPGFTGEVDTAVRKNSFTNRFFISKHVTLYYESPTFEKRLLEVIQWNFDDLDGQPLDVIKEKVAERYIDTLLRIANEGKGGDELLATKTGARLAEVSSAAASLKSVFSQEPEVKESLGRYSEERLLREWFDFVQGDEVYPKGYLRFILSDVEYNILLARLGLTIGGPDTEPKTLRQIAVARRLSYERIRQIEAAAIKKVRLAFLRYLEGNLTSAYMRVLRRTHNVNALAGKLSLQRPGLALSPMKAVAYPKTEDYKDTLSKAFQSAGLPVDKALMLASAVGSASEAKLKARPEFFTDEEIGLIRDRDIFSTESFARAVMKEERSYQALRDKTGVPLLSQEDIDLLLYRRLLPSAWIRQSIKDGLTRARIVRFYGEFNRDFEDWEAFYKPIRDKIETMNFTRDQANLIVTTFKEPLKVAEAVSRVIQILADNGLKSGYSVKHLLISRRSDAIGAYLRHKGIDESVIEQVIAECGARLAFEKYFQGRPDFKKIIPIEEFLKSFETKSHVNADSTVYAPTPTLGILQALDILRMEQGGSLEGLNLLDFGAGVDLRVSLIAASLFGMKVTAIEKDPENSKRALEVLEAAKKSGIDRVENITFLPEKDAFASDLPWEDKDIVFFFYTEPFLKAGADLRSEFRQKLQGRLMESGSRTNLALIFTAAQRRLGVDRFPDLKTTFSEPFEIRAPDPDKKNIGKDAWIYLQIYRAPSARAGQGARLAPWKGHWAEHLSEEFKKGHYWHYSIFRNMLASKRISLKDKTDVLPMTLELLKNSDDPYLRQAAAQVLGHLGSKYSRISGPALQEALKDAKNSTFAADLEAALRMVTEKGYVFTDWPSEKDAKQHLTPEMERYITNLLNGLTSQPIGARLASETPYEPLPNYATGLPMGTWDPDAIKNLVKDGLVHTEDEKELGNEELMKKKEVLVERAVAVLMADTSQVNIHLFDLFEKLLFIPEWDESMKEISLEIIRRVARQSAENILNFSDPIQIEAARRRLYFLAYIEHHPIKYQGWPFKDIFLVTQNQERLKTVHQELMRTVRDILGQKENEILPGYGLLKTLEPVLEEKEKLNQYVFHRAKIDRFESIRENGLDATRTIAGVDEKPEHIFFSDWLSSLGQINDFFDDGRYFHVRVRRDAPTVTESRIRGEGEFGDMASDFLGQTIPVEFIEIVDPYEPWKAYPISQIQDIKAFYKTRAPEVPFGARLASQRYEFEFENGLAVDFSFVKRGVDKPKAVSGALRNYLAGYKNSLSNLWKMHEGDQIGQIRVGDKDRFITITDREPDAFYGEVGAEKVHFNIYQSEDAADSGEAFVAGEIFFFDEEAQTQADTDSIQGYPLGSTVLFDGDEAVVRAIEYRDAGTSKPMPLIHLEIGSLRRVWPLEGIKKRLKLQSGGYRLQDKGLDLEALLKKYAPGSSVQFNGSEAQIKSIEVRDENGTPAIYIGLRGIKERHDEEWKAYSLSEAEKLGLKSISGARLAEPQAGLDPGYEKLARVFSDKYSVFKKETHDRPFVLAIWGPSASKKSTVIRFLKEHLSRSGVHVEVEDERQFYDGSPIGSFPKYGKLIEAHKKAQVLIVELVTYLPPDTANLDMLVNLKAHMNTRIDRVERESGSYELAKERGSVRAAIGYANRPPDLIIDNTASTMTRDEISALIEPFFIGIAHAHSSKIDGARLALDLKEDGSNPYIFTFTKDGETLMAKSEDISITLDRSKLKNGRVSKKPEDSLSTQDLRTLTDTTNNKVTSLLDASGLDTSIPVILSINLSVLDNPSSEFYLNYLIAELQALKHKDKNVFLILEGPEHLSTQAKDRDNTLFLDQIPQDLIKAPVVNLTPSTKTLNKSQVNVPVTLLQEGDIPAFKGLLRLATASGRISTKNIPQNYQDAYSTLAGQRLQTKDIKDILEGSADQKTILKGSLKAITKVAINRAIQLFKTMIRMVGAAA